MWPCGVHSHGVSIVGDVRSGAFPSDDESYHIADDEAEALGLYGKAGDES